MQAGGPVVSAAAPPPAQPPAPPPPQNKEFNTASLCKYVLRFFLLYNVYNCMCVSYFIYY